jgi:hypothetical protein
VIGPLYSVGGNAGVWIEIAGGMTLGALLFVAAVLRSGATSVPAQAPAMSA